MNDNKTTTAKERVEAEVGELGAKLLRLQEFINNNEAFKKLSLAQKYFLRRQAEIMEEYAVILRCRLSIWEEQ